MWQFLVRYALPVFVFHKNKSLSTTTILKQIMFPKFIQTFLFVSQKRQKTVFFGINKSVILIFFCLSVCSCAYAQKKIEKEKNKILTEGLALYTLILANWTSNDLYYENEYPTGYVKGYLSYRDKGDTLKTIFWREIDTASAEYKAKTFKAIDDTGALARQEPKTPHELRIIVKTFCYPKMVVNRRNVVIVEEERFPTTLEKLLMDYRAMAYKEINSDTLFFKQYSGLFLRAVPLDAGRQVKVYVYSGTNREGVVPFGGDYLLVYDKKEKTLVEKKELHKDCLLISTKYKGKSYDASKSTQHSHKEEVSDLITPTDIATLLLYKNQLEWDEHHVVGKKYTSIFTTVDRQLNVVPTEYYEYLKKKKTKQEEEEKKRKMH